MTGTEALIALGTGLNVVSTIQQGSAAAAQGATQAELLRRDAKRTGDIARRDASEFARKTSRMLATRRAEGGVSGVGRTGTVLDVDQNIVAESEFQRLKILSGGADAAQKKELEAKFAEMAGINKRRTSRLRAGSQIFKGAAATGVFGA